MIEIKTLDCGCIEEQETTHQGHMSYITVKTKMCEYHKDLQNEEKRKERNFKKFPNKKSKEIFTMLDNMIDDIYNAGVDVSYFPDEAKKLFINAEKEAKERYDGYVRLANMEF